LGRHDPRRLAVEQRRAGEDAELPPPRPAVLVPLDALAHVRQQPRQQRAVNGRVTFRLGLLARAWHAKSVGHQLGMGSLPVAAVSRGVGPQARASKSEAIPPSHEGEERFALADFGPSTGRTSWRTTTTGRLPVPRRASTPW